MRSTSAHRLWVARISFWVMLTGWSATEYATSKWSSSRFPIVAVRPQINLELVGKGPLALGLLHTKQQHNNSFMPSDIRIGFYCDLNADVNLYGTGSKLCGVDSWTRGGGRLAHWYTDWVSDLRLHMKWKWRKSVECSTGYCYCRYLRSGDAGKKHWPIGLWLTGRFAY